MKEILDNYLKKGETFVASRTCVIETIKFSDFTIIC